MLCPFLHPNMSPKARYVIINSPKDNADLVKKVHIEDKNAVVIMSVCLNENRVSLCQAHASLSHTCHKAKKKKSMT